MHSISSLWTSTELVVQSFFTRPISQCCFFVNCSDEEILGACTLKIATKEGGLRRLLELLNL
jgi:hypothetical protein